MCESYNDPITAYYSMAYLQHLHFSCVCRFFKTSKIIQPFPIDKCAHKQPSTDNVWFQHMHPFNQLTFEEAISYHRESVHETVYNNPGAYVNVVAVLNLKTRKQVSVSLGHVHLIQLELESQQESNIPYSVSSLDQV